MLQENMEYPVMMTALERKESVLKILEELPTNLSYLFTLL